MRHPNLARRIPCRRQGVVLEVIPGGRRICTHRTPGARRCGKGCLPGVQADIGHRITTSRTGALRLLPTRRQTGTRPADHKQPIMLVVPSLPHTEEAEPPRPPPEPPPGVSTAPPRRTTSSGSTSPCPSCGSVFSSVHNMKAHARRTIPGTPIVAEGLACGSCDSSTVFPTSASRAGHYRKCQVYQRAKTDNAPQQAPMTAVALQPLLCCNPHQPLSRDNPREALPHTLWECRRPRQLSIRLFGSTPSRTTAPFKKEKLATSLRTARRPLANSGCKV
ncbi:hypothetical protein TCDM_08742 [Trypanosoma cruzi Dm28c]|uniref:Uncharacterized protein n=1 Tax=Trypanosoma cruzi Dm28c TaxID=1416333 RepID=V5BBJ8_TRYCR|nr:hypothetical protein TCDM_08742 [Trypanosoma cruzi Dm28c]